MQLSWPSYTYTNYTKVEMYYANILNLLCSELLTETLLSTERTMKKGGKFLKKLWCCVGEEYNKIIWLS